MPTDPTQNDLLQVPTQVTVTDVVDHEVDPRKRAQLEALGQQDAGWFGNIWAHFWAAVYDGLAYVMTEIANSLDQVLAFVGKFFLLGQGEKNSAFYDLAGTILEDLTGVPVDKAALKSSTFGSGRIAGMQTFGADLYNQLAKEFAPKNGNLETPDVAPAQIFLGFLMNFAIRQGNIELLTSLLPEGIRVGDGFRAYGELMAKNLGLGRLARMSLKPLITTLVADPLQNSLNAQYRPKRLPKEQAIKAFWRGAISETQMRKELAEEGYSDARQDWMIADARPLLNDREIVHLYLGQLLETQDFLKEMGKRGWNSDEIQNVVEIESPQLTVQEILDLYIFGQLDRATATNGLLRLGYDTGKAENLVLLAEMRAGVVRPVRPRHPRTRTAMQLHKEFLDGVIDLPEWNTQLTQLGYSLDDIAAMTQDLLIDQAHRKTTGTTHAVPSLSWAQIKAAYKSGVLDLAEVEAHLAHRGYSAADIATLVKELPAQPPPATPTGA